MTGVKMNRRLPMTDTNLKQVLGNPEELNPLKQVREALEQAVKQGVYGYPLAESQRQALHLLDGKVLVDRERLIFPEYCDECPIRGRCSVQDDDGCPSDDVKCRERFIAYLKGEDDHEN